MTLPTDQLFSSQWYLQAIGVVWGQNAVWDDYTGAGVHVGIFDNGIQTGHPDLDANHDSTLDFGSQTGLAQDHGTAVTGVVAAERNDVGSGDGIVGVAYGATYSSVPIWGSDTVNSTTSRSAASMHMRDFDVVNHSWGSSAFSVSQTDPNYLAVANGILDAVTNGRGGLGTVVVAAANNTRAGQAWDNVVGDANTTGPTAESRFSITVAGVGQDGFVADYSSPGANILVSAGAQGSWSAGEPGVWTTDFTGTSGFSNGDYVETVGTSFSAPQVTGVVALMLEANPNLGYRDVRDILALTARHAGSDIAFGTTPEHLQNGELNFWTINAATNWNGGGMHFSNDYGFGLIDARAAVRLAETWTDQSTLANEEHWSSTASPNVIVPDANSAGVSFSFTVGGDIDAEQVTLNLGITHTYASDLEIYLISPSGTESRLLDNSGGSRDLNGWTFTSNAFRGEDANGTWTVRVVDNVSGDTGSVSTARLDVYGSVASNNDTYFYTDEFGSNAAIAADGARATIHEIFGVDTINAAAVTSNSYIDLSASVPSTIAGRSLTIDGTIENAFGGDGSDILIGNASANHLSGGRGEDAIGGGGGDDWIEGGADNDSLAGEGGNDRIDGGAGADFLQGGDGNDRLEGGLGADTLRGGAGNDRLCGDVLTRTGEPDFEANTIYGEDGNDTIVVSRGDDRIDGGAGTDTLSFAWTTRGAKCDLRTTSATFVDSGSYTNPDGSGGAWGGTFITHFTGIENVTGGSGADTLIGNGLANTLDGGAGNDILNGGAGADRMIGRAGNDTYYVDNLGDIVDETRGTGTDKIYASVSCNLSNTARVLGAVENLVLTGAGDIAGTGNALANALTGNSGNNVLKGGLGNDSLDGRAGNDQLIGGSGGDRLTGGAGADTFIFNVTTESTLSSTGRDVILDFYRSQGDKLDVSGIDAQVGVSGNQAFHFIGTSAFTHHAGELRYTTQSGNVYVYGDVNGDGAVDFSVQIQNHTSIQASDFIL